MATIVSERFRTSAGDRLALEAAGMGAGGERRWLRRATMVVAAAALVALLGYSQAELTDAPPLTEDESVPVYLPDARFLRLASVGYENALADLLWFRTINYFGKHFRSDRVYPWLARMCDLVTDLDPHAEHVYLFGGLLLPWEASRPDDGIALLEKGLRVFPDSWNMHFVLGFNYFFFRNDIDRALPHIRRASELPDAHPFVSRLATLLYAEQYGSDTARAFLQELQSTAGASTRSVIEQRMNEIQLGQNLSLLDESIRRYRELHGAPPASLESLVDAGILKELPVEPFGGSYRYDPESGEVTSSFGHRPLRLYTSPNRERILKGESLRD